MRIWDLIPQQSFGIHTQVYCLFTADVHVIQPVDESFFYVWLWTGGLKEADPEGDEEWKNVYGIGETSDSPANANWGKELVLL